MTDLPKDNPANFGAAYVRRQHRSVQRKPVQRYTSRLVDHGPYTMPCRICTANDLEALADEIAAGIWSRVRGSGERQDVSWEDAPPYWRKVMLEHARIVVEVARGEHGHDTEDLGRD